MIDCPVTNRRKSFDLHP